MTDPREEKTDWSLVEGQIAPDSAGHSNPPSTPSLDTPESAPAHQMMQRFGSPGGIIMELKQGNIQRKAALEAMKMWHQGQLEVAEVQIAQAVRVHTTKARVEAEQFLARIDTEYLDYLGELGLRNVGKRQEMLVRLADQTTATLKEVQEADWPPTMKDQAVSKVMKMHEDFSDKLDEGFKESE